MAHLFEPLKLRDIVLANRIPPMCQYSARDGMAADWHFAQEQGCAAAIQLAHRH